MRLLVQIPSQSQHSSTTRAPGALPSQPPQSLRSRIQGRHISSSIQIKEGIWQGIDRSHLGWLRWLGGLSFDLGHLREIQRRERASPSSRSYRDPRAVHRKVSIQAINLKRSARRATYNFGIELLDLRRLLIGPSVVEVTHGCRKSGNAALFGRVGFGLKVI